MTTPYFPGLGQADGGPNVVPCGNLGGQDDPPTNRQMLNSAGLSDEEIDGLLQQGWTEEGIIEELLAQQGVVFRRPAAQPPAPANPADPNPGLGLAANVLEAIGMGFWLAGKKFVLGDLTDEPNPLGDLPQYAAAITPADTAADLRDLAVAGKEFLNKPKDPAAQRKLLFMTAALAIPFLSGALMSKIARKVGGEGAEAAGDAAKEGQKMLPAPPARKAIEDQTSRLPEGFIKAAAEARQPVVKGGLKDFVPPKGSGRSPGHARSSHGFSDVNDPVILDIRNNPDRIYVGQNSDGSKVVVFFKDETVVITDAADTTSVITAYGKNAPGRTNNPSRPRSDIWANDPNYYQLD